MKIEPRQYEAAYRVGLDHYDGKCGIVEALKRLEHSGLNRNTAADFVYNVSHLLKGERYTRVLSVPVTDDFLKWIRRDRGDGALAHAVSALQQHIEYYEKKRNIRRPTLREVLAKHQKLLALPSESVILLTWAEEPFSNYTDELPLRWFANDGTLLKKKHFVRDRQDRCWSAFCNVTVSGLIADLNYSPYPDENRKDGMLLGVTRVHFEDDDRSSISKVEWKPQGSKVFKEARFRSPGFRVPPEGVYVPPKDAAGRTQRQVLDRPGRAAFRRKLKAVYGNRCCISACAVPEALEGAHIDPYVAAASDNIRNGLLLRSDLHTLFDRHLIAINPDTMLVHVAKRARSGAGYEQFHGATVKLMDELTHRPDKEALRRRWRKWGAQ